MINPENLKIQALDWYNQASQILSIFFLIFFGYLVTHFVYLFSGDTFENSTSDYHKSATNPLVRVSSQEI